MIRKTFLFLSWCLVLSTLFLFAQNDPTAKQLLDKVSQKYKTHPSMEADFVLTITGEGINEIQTGKVFIKGDKYKFTSKDLDRICDGKTVWTCLKPQKEVQINVVDKSEITPNQLFTLYTKNYTYVSNTELKRPANQAIIDLMPNDKKNTSYFRVRLYIEKTTNQIVKAMLFEKNGTKYVYELKNVKTNTLKDATFVFNKVNYPQAEVIDLR